MSFLIGMDIGGTNIRIGLYSIKNKSIIDYATKTLVKYDVVNVEVEQNICMLIKERMQQHFLEMDRLKGIGISIAANFERSTGNLTRWPNNPKWNGFPLREYLTQYFRVPVVIEDDANSAALGEYICQSKVKDNLLYCTLGTGIGMGIIINKRIYCGDNHIAGEIGHMRIRDNRLNCVCGKTGCLQAFLRKKDNTCESKRIFQYNSNYMCKLTSELAYCLYQIAYLFDISLTIIGGGVVEYDEEFYRKVEKFFFEYVGDNAEIYKIRKSELYNRNGIYGILKLIADAVK